MRASQPTPELQAPGQVHRLPLERASDAELTRAFELGDRAAARVIWERYAAAVHGMLTRSLGPDQEAEDLLHEVFLQFFRSVHNMKDRSAVRAYLLGIALRVAAGELRRRKVRRWVTLTVGGALPDVRAPNHDASARQALVALYRVLDGLSVRLRLTFILRFVEGLEMRDVAVALGVSEPTARRAAKKARQRVLLLAPREPALRPYISEPDSEAEETAP